jgi:hypothetical protein
VGLEDFSVREMQISRHPASLDASREPELRVEIQ